MNEAALVDIVHELGVCSEPAEQENVMSLGIVRSIVGTATSIIFGLGRLRLAISRAYSSASRT